MEDSVIREWDTGATRNSVTDKYNYEGFLSPIVLEAFAKYMHKNRFLEDGSIRDGDNWQKLFGNTLKEHTDVCIDSLLRHVMDLWLLHRGYPAREGLDDALCGIMFNSMAYYYGVLLGRMDSEDDSD